jgi:outer membrane protein OmpA-like peptidoglycan-associated protein
MKVSHNKNSNFGRTFIIALLLFASTQLYPKPYHILDGESPYTLPSFSLETRLMLGYETGYIPDVFIRPWFDMGIFNWLMVGGGVYYTWFPNQEESKLTEWEVRGKIRVLDISSGRNKQSGFFKTGGTQLFGFIKFRKSDFTLIKSITIDNDDYWAISHRADGGWDLTAGISMCTLFSMFGQNFGLFTTADYSWTGGRNYYPDELQYQSRLAGNIMPVYYMNIFPTRYVDRDSMFIGVQNRFTYWFERGYMYSVMPQITWEFKKNMTLSAAVSFPATSRNDYRVLVEFSAMFEFFRISANIDVDPDDDFTPDGNGINDILHLEPSIKSKESIRNWTITIKDGKRTIKTYRGEGLPKKKIAWNGKTDNNYPIESLKEYDVIISVVDVMGNRDSDNTDFTSGLILEKIPNGYKIVISNIEFGTGKEAIQKQASKLLNKIADYLDEHYHDYAVKIEGHTDNVGGKAYNQNLSVRRANAVMNYLVRKGINKKRLTFNGFGETMPIEDNNTEEGRARNRRVEFILLKMD